MSAPVAMDSPLRTASDLRAMLEYQCQVNAILLASTRPKGRKAPLLSGAELDELEQAYLMGLTAAGFATRLAERDVARAKMEGPAWVARLQLPLTDTDGAA